MLKSANALTDSFGWLSRAAKPLPFLKLHFRQHFIGKKAYDYQNNPEEKLIDNLQSQKNNVKDQKNNKQKYEKPNKFSVIHLAAGFSFSCA